ncbi:septal ring factor EnvC (AmiA/AmiB activator) [Breoghania corrubedonensis]|uniref:Septal ring factor EnvC (AmiA/AmiB activator) n=1 Tax=Breoghania corrubedonensis TaxID=665038 RepID=A0A2T5VGJ4_9HYPH|nr:peptidoglycan DD-metalloendopeptidase family protein [Breoghania corrubedonensis]PTW62877.1 septal ring factor EnvC (AmiA/AmiB activator) [Breoghania corrubedonensis]
MQGASRLVPGARQRMRALIFAGGLVLAGAAAAAAFVPGAHATQAPETGAGQEVAPAKGPENGTQENGTQTGSENGADNGQGADLSDLDPAERKEAREKELAALTDDITLSETRQRELKHQIDTIDRHRDALNADLLRTAQRVHSLEEELSATEARLLRLHENADTVRASLHERRDVLAEVLATLERIGRRPPPALAVRPKDALGAVRSAMLLNAVMPGIHDEAEALAVDLGELTKLEGRIAGERDRLKSDGSRLAEEKTRIELLLKAKREEADESRRKLAEETGRSRELAKKATSLKGLIASLESEIESSRKAAEAAAKAAKENAGKPKNSDPFADPGRLAPAVAFADTKGKLHLPVAGAPLRAFGEEDSLGTPAEGLSIATRNDARVTAPCDGWVVYSGPFRSYGQLLILNAGDGYHVLLAGMDKIDAELGQFVLAGEPIGSMGSTQLASAATLDLGSTRPVLYIEFRKDGSSIDPSPWWAKPEDEKVRG